MNRISSVMNAKEMQQLRIYLALKEAEEEAARTTRWLTHDEVMESARCFVQEMRGERERICAALACNL
ncbi:MAG: hypothetical protein FWD06_07275 [Oscillospiraceae bacterium]|nr:hypothetical protein [Oscillospiraceae bacterium]